MAQEKEELEQELEQELAGDEQTQVQEAESRRMQLMELGITLGQKLNKAIIYKGPIEARMLLDEAQYWGQLGGSSTKDDIAAGRRGSSGSMPVDNKTRSKTRIAAARIGDMLFPTNTPNWALRPSPYPEVPDDQLAEEYQRQMALQAPGPEGAPPAPLPVDYEALADAVADQACRKMSRRISDVLSESMYPKHGRAAIVEACRLGTGIVKGPYNRGILRRRYRPLMLEGQRIDVLETDVVPTPAIARVSVWNFFPMPARNVEECEAAFELHLPTATMLRQMVVSHGFDKEMTAEVLRQGPHRGEVDSLLSQRASITGENNVSYEENWALWEYHGPIPRDAIEAWGYDLENEEDELQSLYGEVWFCHNLPLRVSLTMLEADSSLPYHVFNYEKDETSIFGFGIPFIMRDDQRVIDTMWDAMQFNAAVSAGPQIAITKGVMTPSDGSYNIRGPKLWYKNDEDMSIKDAIEVFVIPSTIQNNMPLYEQAKANADENTNLPLMLGDTMGQAPAIPTSGLSMLINQQNIVQRQAAHNWDDDVTARLIPRMYDWFMQHDPDPSIKGDFEVEVRGASYLLIKDTQAQHAQLLIQLAAQDPGLAQMLNLDALYRVYLGFMDIPVERLLKSPEQVSREKAAAPPDPMQQLMVEEKTAIVEKLRAETAAANAKAQAGGVTEKDVMEMELEYAKLQGGQYQVEAQLEIERTRQNTQLLRAAADEKIAYQQIQSDMEKFYSQREVDTQLRLRKQQSDDFFKAAELRLAEARDRLKTLNLSRGFDTF